MKNQVNFIESKSSMRNVFHQSYLEAKNDFYSFEKSIFKLMPSHWFDGIWENINIEI